MAERAFTHSPANNGLPASVCRLAIDAFAQCDRRKLSVHHPFLVQIGGQQAQNVGVAEFVCPGNERALECHFVMFDSLSRADDRGVKHALILDFTGDVVSFLY
jgi:hypothetical protein